MTSLRRLSDALWHGPPDQAREAAHELARRPDPRAIPPLIGALGRTGVVDAAADALVALGEEAVPALVSALRREVAARAAGVLARLGPAASAAVLAGTWSPNAQVRRHCVLIVPAVAPEPLPVLWDAWADTDCGVRSAAHQRLETMNVRLSPGQLIVEAERCQNGYRHVDVCGFTRFAGRPHVREVRDETEAPPSELRASANSV